MRRLKRLLHGLTKGLLLMNQGDTTKLFNAIIEQIDPKHALTWNNKAKSLISLMRYEEAVQSIDKALQIDPNLAIAWDNKAWALGNLEKYDEAIQCIDKALQVDPEFALPWYRKGWTLVKLGRYNEALRYFDRAKQLRYEG